MKRMLEQAIPAQQAFIQLVDGETHHVQRDVAPKEALIIAYGDYPEEEKDLFRELVARNAKNMSFSNYRLRFVGEEEAGGTKLRRLRSHGHENRKRGTDGVRRKGRRPHHPRSLPLFARKRVSERDDLHRSPQGLEDSLSRRASFEPRTASDGSGFSLS